MSFQAPLVEIPKIGPYDLKEQIGVGRSCVVRVAHHRELDQEFACKITPKHLYNTLELKEQFRNEIRILMKIKHPNIISILDFYEDLKQFYIISELENAGDLQKTVVQQRYMDESTAKVIFRQLIDALRYLQSQGITHHDIKAENLLIASNQIKLVDFGFSFFSQPGELVSFKTGTLGYQSPEIVENKMYDPYKSDIWSCGVLLFYMVTGRMPWTISNHLEMQHCISNAEYSIPMSISGACAMLIQRILKIDPEARPTFAEILNDPFLAGASKHSSIQYKSPLPAINTEEVEEILKIFIEGKPKVKPKESPVKAEITQSQKSSKRKIEPRPTAPGKKPPWRPNKSVYATKGKK